MTLIEKKGEGREWHLMLWFRQDHIKDWHGFIVVLCSNAHSNVPKPISCSSEVLVDSYKVPSGNFTAFWMTLWGSKIALLPCFAAYEVQIWWGLSIHTGSILWLPVVHTSKCIMNKWHVSCHEQMCPTFMKAVATRLWRPACLLGSFTLQLSLASWKCSQKSFMSIRSALLPSETLLCCLNLVSLISPFPTPLVPLFVRRLLLLY